jgi:uncharacterized membrane protein YagU involved in acid resistance
VRDAAFLNVLATALLGVAAMAFTRQRRFTLVCCGALFVLVVTWSTVAVWWGISPALTVAILVILMGLPLLALLLFAIDVVWSPFCLEMTWVGMICWVFWPILISADALALAARLWLR